MNEAPAAPAAAPQQLRESARPPRSVWTRPLTGRDVERAAWALAPCAVFLLAVWARLACGPVFLDDAYISFRYAWNAAHGMGLVYDAGQWVMGASCPLWLVVLTLAGRCGASIPGAAYAIGVASGAAGAVLLYAIALRLGGRPAAVLAGVVYALEGRAVYTACCGMETALFIALILAITLCWQARRWALAGVLCGLVSITRPEGVLFAATALVSIGLSTRRMPWRAAYWALLPGAVWAAFALHSYGTVVPHSVVAKDAAYVSLAPLTDATAFAAAAASPAMAVPTVWPLLACALAALCALALSSPAARRLPLLWGLALYVVAYAAVDKPLFSWYVLPVAPAAALLGALGVCQLRPARAAWASAACCVAAVAILAPALRPDARAIRVSAGEFWEPYAQAGRWIARNDPGCRTIMTTEIGVIGWTCRTRQVLDAAGLVSPQLLTRGNAFGSPALIGRVLPDAYMSVAKFDEMPHSPARRRYYVAGRFGDPSSPRGLLTLYVRRR